MSRNTRKLSFVFVALVTLFLSVNANARTRTIDTDVVVVGTGAAGLAASVSAAETGAKVVALEKLPVTGGSSAFAEGLFAVQTDEQKKLFITYTPEEMFKKAMEISQGYKVNPSLIMKYIKESTATIDWLKKQGLGFKPARTMPGEAQVWHLVREYKGRHNGAALVTRLADRAEALGVKIMLETPGKKLLFKDGVVKGVEAADKRGNKIIINAGAVILATGGFPDSKEKIRKWTSFDPDVIETFIPLDKTGDGIDMAMDVGGKLVGTGMMVAPLFKDEFVPGVNQVWALQWENNLWVNKNGDRFIDETMVYNFIFGGNIIEAQPGSFAWSIFDERTMNRLETKGSRTGAGAFIAPLTKLTKVRKEMKQAVEKGSKRVAIADSIDGLAKMIGIDPVKLKKTIKQYNKIVETGRDEAFARDYRTITPITQPKYYAIMVRTLFLTSIGGIAVTTDFEATNSNDEVIKGLYVTGSDVGGKYGGSYPSAIAGSEYSFSCTSGRLAGTNATKYVKGL